MNSPFLWLPDVVLLKIFKYLTISELCQGTRQVCKKYHDLSYDFSLWQYIDLRDVCDIITTWDNFCQAFEKTSNYVEELSLTNCHKLLKSDENILWSNMNLSSSEESENLSHDEKTEADSLTFANLRKINFGHFPVDSGFIQMICVLVDQFPLLNAIVDIGEQETCNLLNILAIRKGTWNELHYPHAEYLSDKHIDQALLDFASMNNELKVLSLQNSMVDDKQILQICKACPKLQKLDIPESEWIVDGLKTAAPFLSNLTYLNISKSRLNDQTFGEVCRHCVNLKYVNISHCFKISEIGISTLASNAKDLETLILNDSREILFQNGHLTNVVLEEIGKHAENLRRLQCAYCPNISSEGLCYVAKGCKKLRCLDIRDCLSVTDKAVIAIAENCRQLEELNAFNCTHLTSASINFLIVQCEQLHTLELGTCHYLAGLNFSLDADKNLMMTGAKSLKKSASNDSTSAVSYVESRLENGATDEDSVRMKMQGLDSSVIESSYVEEVHSLSKSDNQIESYQKEVANACDYTEEKDHYIDGYTSVMHKLLAMTTSRLRFLDLSCCSQIANDSVKQIANFCVLLRCLNLRGCCKVTDQGIIAIVKNCKMLQALNIAGTMVIERSRFTNESLFAISRYCQNLVMLDITKNPLMSIKGIASVITSCSSLKRLRVSVHPDGVKINDLVKTVYYSRKLLSCDRFNFNDLSVQSILEGGYSNLTGDYMIKFPKLGNSEILE